MVENQPLGISPSQMHDSHMVYTQFDPREDDIRIHSSIRIISNTPHWTTVDHEINNSPLVNFEQNGHINSFVLEMLSTIIPLQQLNG